MQHFDISREVSVESCNYNNIKYVSFPMCMSGERASFYNLTNTNDEFNNCSLNNSKIQNKKLSLQSSLVQEFDQKDLGSGALPNKEYFAKQNWELYSENKIKSSFPPPVGNKLSQDEFIMMSSSAMKAKPEKYKFPKQDSPPTQGLTVFTPRDIYLYILNLVHHRLTPEIYELWCQLTE